MVLSIHCAKQTFLTLAEVEVIGNVGDIPKRSPVSSVVCGNSVTSEWSLARCVSISVNGLTSVDPSPIPLPLPSTCHQSLPVAVINQAAEQRYDLLLQVLSFLYGSGGMIDVSHLSLSRPRDLDEHYRRAIAANPRNAFILREFPAYIASYEKYVGVSARLYKGRAGGTSDHNR
jgi:hypothetical protein